MSKRFDAVVIGGRLSAVLTAALLAKRGLRGLLVDQGELTSVGSDHVDDEAGSLFGSGVIERVLRELELKDAVGRVWSSCEPLLHVVFPDDRIDLTADLERSLRSLDRVAPGTRELWEELTRSHDEVGGLLDAGVEIPGSPGLFGRRGTVSAAKRAPRLTQTWSPTGPGGLARILVSGLSPFLTHVDPREPEELLTGRLARPVVRFFGGVGTIRHAGGLRGLFLAFAESKAFQVRRTAVERLEPDGRGWSVRLAGSREPVLADAIVDASTDLSGAEVIPSRKQGRQLPVSLQAARPRGYLYAFGLEVDRHVLPPGLGRRLLLLNGRFDPARFDPEEPDSRDRPIWLVLRDGDAPDRVRMVALHPFSSVQAHGAEAVASKDRVVRARLERLFPFLPDGHPEPFMPGATGYGPPYLSHPHFDPGLDEVTGLGGVPTRTALKTLFLAGPAVLPGLGHEGEYLAALQAADAVETTLTGGRKKRGPVVEV